QKALAKAPSTRDPNRSSPSFGPFTLPGRLSATSERLEHVDEKGHARSRPHRTLGYSFHVLMKSIADAPPAQPFRSPERMPLDLPLRCRRGRVRGVASDVSPSTGFRFVCYCKDCQAFARFLKRADVLDPAGGTDIFQMPPGRVSEFSRLGRCPRRIQDRSRPVQ